MKLIKSSHSEVFTYDNAEERLDHIEVMEQDGWSNSGRVKHYTGDWFKDSVADESKYVYIGEFYKEENH